MNLECDFFKIECPNCSNVWISKAKAKRVQCSVCGKFFKNPSADKSAKVLKSQQIIQDNIMQGDILDAMDRANIDPMNNKKVIKDYIPLLLDDDKLEFALAKACTERKRGAKTIIKKALRMWLKDEGFL